MSENNQGNKTLARNGHYHETPSYKHFESFLTHIERDLNVKFKIEDKLKSGNKNFNQF